MARPGNRDISRRTTLLPILKGAGCTRPGMSLHMTISGKRVIFKAQTMEIVYFKQGTNGSYNFCPYLSAHSLRKGVLLMDQITGVPKSQMVRGLVCFEGTRIIPRKTKDPKRRHIISCFRNFWPSLGMLIVDHSTPPRFEGEDYAERYMGLHMMSFLWN